MQNNAKRRGLSFLLILAMLFVSVAVVLPVATSADPAEFADFGVQKLASLDLAGDEDTDLRFLFTVGSLDYTEVGFVFSKTNAAPTIDGDACYKKAVTAVHTSIVADGNTLTADPGRFWVAVKMTDVPHAYFDGALYVRPFVTDGEGTRYADAALTSVCKAAGHVHTIDEFEHQRTGGTAALDVAGTIVGTCPGCNLEVTFNDAKSAVESQKWTAGGEQARMYDRRQISDILAGGKHFYPDESNGGLGLDLYVEYSFLWNNTFENLGNNSTSGGHAIIDTRLCSESGDKGKGNDLTWMSLKNNASGSSCKFAGGFEFGSLRTVESGPDGMSTTKSNNDDASGTTYDDFPNIGGTDKNNPEWGWHRVGVKFHQEVTNEAALKADTTGDVEATYYFFVETYIDGVLVSRLSNAASPNFGESTAIKENLLFTAKSDKNGGIEYEDGDEGCYVNGMRLPFYNTTTGTAYVVYADYFATAGTDFVQSVTKNGSPAANTYTTKDGTDTVINAPIYYTINP